MADLKISFAKTVGNGSLGMLRWKISAIWPVFTANRLNHSGTPFATDLSLNVVSADLSIDKKRKIALVSISRLTLLRPSNSVPMFSLRMFIAVIATASLSSTVAAQETIPNWGLCGGIMFQGQKPRPCADGWPCVVLSERSRYYRSVFHETNILLYYQMISISMCSLSFNAPKSFKSLN